MNTAFGGLVRSRVLLAVALLIVANTFAQNPDGSATPAPRPASADEQWDALRALITKVAPLAKHTQAPNLDAQNLNRQQQLAKFLQIADKAKAFRMEFPNHAKATDARALEIDGLMAAVKVGDAAIENRLDLAAGELRADESLPTSLRARVTGNYLFSRAVRKNKTQADRIAAIEQTARDLIREYPGEPQGYESLLNVALGGDDEKYRTLLFALWQSSAPLAVKYRVRTRLDRHFLRGEKLSLLLADVGESKLSEGLMPNRPTIIYAWATGNEASLVMAEVIRLRGLENVNVIGLCLDQNVGVARQEAKQAKLPGTLYYDERGRGGALATRLKIDEAPAVILVEADGYLFNTRGEHEFAAKLTQLGL